jgi:hypothetical protein
MDEMGTAMINNLKCVPFYQGDIQKAVSKELHDKLHLNKSSAYDMVFRMRNRGHIVKIDLKPNHRRQYYIFNDLLKTAKWKMLHCNKDGTIRDTDTLE